MSEHAELLARLTAETEALQAKGMEPVILVGDGEPRMVSRAEAERLVEVLAKASESMREFAQASRRLSQTFVEMGDLRIPEPASIDDIIRTGADLRAELMGPRQRGQYTYPPAKGRRGRR